jgi:hypothetical protein
LIKSAAFIYVGITFTAALLRTLFIVVISRIILPMPEEPVTLAEPESGARSWSAILNKTWQRFKRRMRKILIFTVPIYIIIFIMNRMEFFAWLESVLASKLEFIPWLSPQAMGIIALHVAAELTAGLAAAGALLQDGILGNHEVVVALLIGNILSSPLRAVRHQLPYYAGIFKPKLALELIVCNQSFRILSLVFASLIYFTLAIS